MRSRQIEIGCKFGDFHLGSSSAVKKALNQIRPIFENGGEVALLHLDGPVRRMLKGIHNHPEAKTLDQIAVELVDFWKKIHAVYPKIRIGLITNSPNWDFTEELRGFNGDYTTSSDITYLQVLEKLYGALTQAGERIAFVEVDCPYNYYREKRTRDDDGIVNNPRKFKELQQWCFQRQIQFHIIINAEPRNGTAKMFHDLTINYVYKLYNDGIFPDLFLIQSWYKVSENHTPEVKPYTFMNTARDAIRLIRQLFPGEY